MGNAGFGGSMPAQTFNPPSFGFSMPKVGIDAGSSGFPPKPPQNQPGIPNPPNPPKFPPGKGGLGGGGRR